MGCYTLPHSKLFVLEKERDQKIKNDKVRQQIVPGINNSGFEARILSSVSQVQSRSSVLYCTLTRLTDFLRSCFILLSIIRSGFLSTVRFVSISKLLRAEGWIIKDGSWRYRRRCETWNTLCTLEISQAIPNDKLRNPLSLRCGKDQ